MIRRSKRFYIVFGVFGVFILVYFLVSKNTPSVQLKKNYEDNNLTTRSLDLPLPTKDTQIIKSNGDIDISQNRKMIFENYSVEEIKLITIASRKKWNPELVKKFISQSKGITDKKKLKEIAKSVAHKDISVRMGLLKWIRLNHGGEKKDKILKKSDKKKKLRDIILKKQ